MRPITRAALSGLAAAALTAAIPAAAAPPTAAPSGAYLSLGPATGAAADARAGRDKWIEVESWSWGRARKGWDGTIKGRAESSAGKVSVSDLSVMRGPRQTTSLDGAQGETNTAKYGAISGLHRNDALARAGDAPPAALPGPAPGPGSIRIKVKIPWLDCAPGAAFPDAALRGGGALYAFSGVTVASCPSPASSAASSAAGGEAPTDSLTLNYTKVIVRGWDPERKE